MLDRARKDLGLCGAFALAEEGLHDQVENVTQWHVAEKAPQKAQYLDRIMGEFIYKELADSGGADFMNHLARQNRRIDLRALEVLVPIDLVVNETALHVLLPKRRPTVDAEPVE